MKQTHREDLGSRSLCHKKKRLAKQKKFLFKSAGLSGFLLLRPGLLLLDYRSQFVYITQQLIELMRC